MTRQSLIGTLADSSSRVNPATIPKSSHTGADVDYGDPRGNFLGCEGEARDGEEKKKKRKIKKLQG